MALSDEIPPGSAAVLSPVQRLAKILSRAVTEHGLEQQVAGAAICILLGVPHEKRRSWSQAYVDLLDLFDEAREYTKSLIGTFDGSPHANTFTEIQTVLSSITLDAAWQNYVVPLRQLATIALPFVVHDTDGSDQPRLIEAGELEEVRRDLDALLDKILKSAFPSDFKRQFARDVEHLRDTIIRFHIYGPEGVERAEAQVVGSLIINESVAKSDESIVRDTADTISKVEDVLLKSAKLGKLVAAVVLKLIGPGS